MSILADSARIYGGAFILAVLGTSGCQSDEEGTSCLGVNAQATPEDRALEEQLLGRRYQLLSVQDAQGSRTAIKSDGSERTPYFALSETGRLTGHGGINGFHPRLRSEPNKVDVYVLNQELRECQRVPISHVGSPNAELDAQEGLYFKVLWGSPKIRVEEGFLHLSTEETTLVFASSAIEDSK